MIYAFGKIPTRGMDDLIKFMEYNEGLFILPEGFVGTYDVDQDVFCGLTQDYERTIVAGSKQYGMSDCAAILFLNGESNPVSGYHSFIQVNDVPRVAEVRVCQDIYSPYSDEEFDILLHLSSGSLTRNFNEVYPFLKSKAVISSDYSNGSIWSGGVMVGEINETPEGIRYTCLDSLDL